MKPDARPRPPSKRRSVEAKPATKSATKPAIKPSARPAAKPAQRSRTVISAKTKKSLRTRPVKTATVARPSNRRAGSAQPVSSETLRGGQAWSRVLGRGQILRITDTSGRGAVAALFYNARNPLERYNMADTLKAQYTAFLTAGRVLYSDMGRILVSIIADSCGWHDTVSGCGNAVSQALRLGSGTYQDLRNEFHRNTRDNFVVELGKVGLGKRDIVSNVNFFVRIGVDLDGNLAWAEGDSRAGASVELRAEMDTLVVLSNTPHPLDPSSAYAPPPVALSIRDASPAELAGPDDTCRLSRPENGRGFALTEAYVAELASGIARPAALVHGRAAWG